MAALTLREEFESLLISPHGHHPNVYEAKKAWDENDATDQQLSEEIERATRWLKTVEQTKNFNPKVNSYRAKHVAEEAEGDYISNGCLLMAAHRLGFLMSTDESLNPYLNISSTSMKAPVD